MDARRWGAQGERPGATGRASCSTKDGMGSHQQRLTQRSEFKVEQSRGITSFPTPGSFPALSPPPAHLHLNLDLDLRLRLDLDLHLRLHLHLHLHLRPHLHLLLDHALVRYLRPRCPHQFIGFPRVIWGLVDSLPPPSPRQHAHLPFACPCRVGLGLQRRRTRADDVEGVEVQGGQDA